MAPQKSKSQADSLKQKSIISWFGQPSSHNAKATQSKLTTENVASKSRAELNTPKNKGRDAHVGNSPSGFSSKSSDAGLSALETPPTSDPVDVEMLSMDEEEHENHQPVSASLSSIACSLLSSLKQLNSKFVLFTNGIFWLNKHSDLRQA
jgi:DNA mismatch repair protein MSH6